MLTRLIHCRLLRIYTRAVGPSNSCKTMLLGLDDMSFHTKLSVSTTDTVQHIRPFTCNFPLRSRYSWTIATNSLRMSLVPIIARDQEEEIEELDWYVICFCPTKKLLQIYTVTILVLRVQSLQANQHQRPCHAEHAKVVFKIHKFGGFAQSLPPTPTRDRCRFL